MWSRVHQSCVTCKSADRPHGGKGLCVFCYHKARREGPEFRDRILAQKTADYRRSHARNLALRKAYRERRNFGGNREAALMKAGHRCERCSGSEKLTVHHKDRSGRGKREHNNDVSNLEVLCRRCHMAEHRREFGKRGGTKKLERWSRKFDACVACETTRLRHYARGFCRTCYAKNV